MHANRAGIRGGVMVCEGWGVGGLACTNCGGEGQCKSTQPADLQSYCGHMRRMNELSKRTEMRLKQHFKLVTVFIYISVDAPLSSFKCNKDAFIKRTISESASLEMFFSH